MTENKCLKSSGFNSSAEEPSRFEPRLLAKTDREIRLEGSLRDTLTVIASFHKALSRHTGPGYVPGELESGVILKAEAILAEK